MMAFLRFMLRPRKLVELLAVIAACVLISDGGVPGRIDLYPSVSAPVRAALIAAVAALWLGASWWRFRRGRVATTKLFDTLGDAGAAPGGALEADELRQPLTEALAMLREQGEDRLGRDYASVLPWFLVLGPPGAGKASLVEGSGLPMPLEEQFGRRGLRTRIAGGTRWWFTDEALLISPQGASIAGSANGNAPQWRNLLDFLVERRQRRPVDGVLLVVDADRLLGGEGRQAAAMLRVRLQEAMRRFGARLQVYLVISKADRLSGFAEYFAGADARRRADAFGLLLPTQEPAGQERLLDRLRQGLGALEERLGRDMPGCVSNERDARRRARACGFPGQFTQLARAVQEFCAELLRAGRHDTALLLRGVFLASAGPAAAGAGAGAIDAWEPGFAAGLGLVAAPGAAGHVATPLFVNGLFRQVAFPEAGLVGRNPRVERRHLLLHGAGYALCAAALAASLGMFLSDFREHDALLGRMQDEAGAGAQLVAATPAHPRVADVLPALDAARALTELDPDHSWGNPLGISEVLAAADRNYERMLRRLLLPALQRHLEAGLRAAVAAGASPGQVRGLLTSYLELGTPDRFSRAAMQGWSRRALDEEFAFRSQLLDDAGTHLARLLELMPAPVALDQQLIADARNVLRAQPSAAAIYAQLKISPLLAALPAIDVVNSLGPAGAQLLMLRSQARLPTIVPPLYTREGFYQVFVPQAPAMARNIGANDWILGPVQASDVQAQALLRQVSDLYVRDYIAQWRVVLDQISLRALPDLASVTAALQTLSGVDSPLVQLVNLVRAQTDLPVPAPPSGTLLSQAENIATARGVPPTAVAGTAGAVGKVLGSEPAFGQGMPWPGDAIRTVFAPLQALAGGQGAAAQPGQTPMLRVQNTLAGAFGTVSAVQSALEPGAAAQTLAAQVISGQSTDALIGLRVQAATLPRPISDVMRELYSSVWSSLLQLAAARLQAGWARDVDAACQASIAGRYPFVAADSGDATDVALADFSAFFGRGGTLDKFVTGNLALFTQPGPNGDLVPISDHGLSLNIAPEALRQINRARQIRNQFFGSDGNLQLRLFLQPTYLDPRATTATLVLDKTTLRDRHDPPQSTLVAWPPVDSGGNASFRLETVGGATPTISASGPWAMFRLLGQAQRGPGAARDEQTVSFTLDGLRSAWLLRARSVANPFTTPDLMGFRCVPRL